MHIKIEIGTRSHEILYSGIMDLNGFDVRGLFYFISGSFWHYVFVLLSSAEMFYTANTLLSIVGVIKVYILLIEVYIYIYMYLRVFPTNSSSDDC